MRTLNLAAVNLLPVKVKGFEKQLESFFFHPEDTVPMKRSSGAAGLHITPSLMPMGI